MSELLNMKWSPVNYREAAFLAQEACEEMLSRLDWMTIKPAVIVDAGAGLGELACALAGRYPQAKVYAVDLSGEMLAEAGLAAAIEYRLEDAAKLSLPDHSVDLVCANFLLPWVSDVNACLKEWRRVLAPDGLLMLSALGSGTLQEVQGLLPAHALPRLLDMHDLGDALVAAGFADPVMDTARYPVRYHDKQRMQEEWQASGLLQSGVTIADIELLVTFEVVHGHAFAPKPSSEFRADEDGVVRVPLRHLRRMPGE
jgi:malonyl-CoA O-methyltransferase